MTNPDTPTDDTPDTPPIDDTPMELLRNDLPQLLMQPYNPNDFKDEDGDWLPFDPKVEWPVIQNDLYNGRRTDIGIARMNDYILTQLGAGTKTFAAPLKDTNGVVSLEYGPNLGVPGGKLTINLGNLTTAIKGTTLKAASGKLDVDVAAISGDGITPDTTANKIKAIPSTQADNVLKQGTDANKSLYYKPA